MVLVHYHIPRANNDVRHTEQVLSKGEVSGQIMWEEQESLATRLCPDTSGNLDEMDEFPIKQKLPNGSRESLNRPVSNRKSKI